MKIYEKQSQKMSNQNERTTNTTTTTKQFAKQITQQPNFTKNNNQTLNQDNTIMLPSPAVTVNQQKELKSQYPQYQAPQTLNSIAKFHNNKPFSKPTQEINKPNSLAGVLCINQSNSNYNSNNNNLGVKSIIKSADPTVNQNIQQQERQAVWNNNNIHHKQQHPNNQHPNSITALNQIHNQMKNNQKTNQMYQPNNTQNNRQNPQRAQTLHQDNQYSKESTHTINNIQDSKKIMGLKEITSNTISPSINTNKIGNKHNSNHAFRSLSKEFDMDTEMPASIQQLPINNNLSINNYQERLLLSDLSKSGRVNQERTNNFPQHRGEIKELNNSLSNNEVPKYLKEKSVRNPTFYPTKQEESQVNKDKPILPKKNNFSYSSVSSRDGSLEKSSERPYGSEKENSFRRAF